MKMRFNQDWKARILDGEHKTDYFSATVPGNVQRDYAEHIGILENLQFANNVAKLESVEKSTWEYKAELNYDLKPDQKLYFVAEGIDYIFDILLDGEKVYSQEGMYTPVELDLTKKAHKGSILQVIIHPHPIRSGSYIRTRDEASQSCKPPVCYGWDWNPRLLISGIWMPAFLETRGKAFINTCEPSYKLDLEKLHADLSFDIDCEEAPVITIYAPDGKEVYCGTETEISIDNVELWWCNGQGEPNLYTWKAETSDDTKTGTIGFKTLRLVRNKGFEIEEPVFPKPQLLAPITIELNGRRIFAKGSNYVNPELFFGNISKETYETQVLYAKEAHMNIFRIWGGAGLAKPEFYDLCDKHGILVWQEFMLACNDYTGTKHYLSVLEREAISVIKKMRHHACLAFWCGGNELFNAWSGLDEQSHALRLLNKLCYEYDNDRPFIMTSPITGMAHGGYTFVDRDGREVFEMFQSANFSAYTEFGVPSISPVHQLRKIIPEDELFPIVKTDAWIAHHGFEAWRPASWVHLETLEQYFGKSESLEETVARSTWLQCEGYKAVFEEGRRQWPSCSMSLNWCFNEPWVTAAGNSLISYPNIQKPAYFAVKDSLRPIMASARIPKFSWIDGEKLSFELWYHNDTNKASSNTVKVEIELGNKKFDMLSWETGEVDANSNKMGPTVNFVIPADEKANKLIVRIVTDDGIENKYELLYKCRVEQKALRGLNQ